MHKSASKTKALEPRLLLANELQQRCKRNPNYSMRAFAKTLGVSHTFLSMLMRGERPFTPRMLSKIGDTLNLDPNDRNRLLNIKVPRSDNSHQVSLDIFSIISDWYHYGILNLMKLPDFKSNKKWIAKRLGISELQVSLAIERLIRIEFIEEDSKGNWTRAIGDIEIDNQMYSGACKKFQGQVLDKAKESLENDSFHERAVESFTLVMDSSKINYARKRLREVSKELSNEFEGLGGHTEVYNLGIQIYPISKSKNKEGSK